MMPHMERGRQWLAEHAHGIRNPKALPADVAQRLLSEIEQIPIKETGRKSKGKKVKGAKKKVEGAKKVTSNPQGDLHNAVQKRLKRNPSPEDIVYSYSSEEGPFQATITLSEAVLGSTQSISGEGGCPKKIDAKSSAAAKALELLGDSPSSRKPERDLHSGLKSKGKKVKDAKKKVEGAKK